MTLLFAESFADGQVDTRFNRGATGNATTGRFGGGSSAWWASSATPGLQRSVTGSATFIVGFGFKQIPAAWAGASSTPNLSFYTGGGGQQELALRAVPNGGWGVYRNTTLLANSATGLMVADQWHFIEMKGTLASSGGRAIVRVDGVVAIDFTGNTLAGGSTTLDNIRINGLAATTNNIVYSDLYLLNALGSINNDFLGDVQVENLMPDGNGALSQLLGSDGNSVDNYLLVDETTIGGAGDYAGGASEGQIDTYTMANMASGGSQVFGVQANLLAAKSEAGTKYHRPIVRRGGTNYPGASSVLTTSYISRPTVFETDPSTGVAWTKAGVDAMELGMEVRNS